MIKQIKKLTDLKEDWMFYKKKPIIIKATKVVEKEIWIATREGFVKAFKGDYIIQGIQGEIYPCGRDIFNETYEDVIDKEED